MTTKINNLRVAVIIIIINMLIGSSIFAQSPEAFKYQAIARDASGNVIANQNVSFRISIIKTSATGTPVYVETHYSITNEFGLININIGEGSVIWGNFSNIDWGIDKYFIKVELDASGGSNYQSMGTSQLLSVPYALYSKSAGNVQNYTAGNGISITGNVIENTAPDQTVVLNGSGATTVTGAYPNFTISSTDNNTTYTAGSGINITGTTITNTQPDQAVSLTGQGSTTVTGTYPNFTISSTDNNTTYTAGTGLTLTGTTFSHNAHTGDVSGTTALSVTGIQGKPVSSTTPTINQIYKWNGTNWSYIRRS